MKLPLTIISLIGLSFQFITRPEIDQITTARMHVHQNILILDVAMADAVLMAGQHSLDDLKTQKKH
jgi:hypothetical protein